MRHELNCLLNSYVSSSVFEQWILRQDIEKLILCRTPPSTKNGLFNSALLYIFIEIKPIEASTPVPAAAVTATSVPEALTQSSVPSDAPTPAEAAPAPSPVPVAPVVAQSEPVATNQTQDIHQNLEN